MDYFYAFKQAVIVKGLRWMLVPKKINSRHDAVLEIPSRDADRTIKIHVYRATKAATPGPVLINWHGSGFVLPLHGSDDQFARRIVRETDFTVLDCTYRLGPEHPFPAATNDAEDVVRWVLSKPDEYDVSRISLSGFSAGANLALGISGHVFPKDTFQHVVAFYPPADLSLPYLDRPKAPDPNGKPIPMFVSDVFDDCYTPAPIDRSQPLVSPALCEPERFTPRMLFITCSGDALCVDAEILAAKIKAVPGNKVVLERMEGCDHAWDKSSPSGSPGGKLKERAYAMAVELLSS